MWQSLEIYVIFIYTYCNIFYILAYYNMPGPDINKVHEDSQKNVKPAESARDVRENSRKDLTLSLNVDLHFDTEESKDRFIRKFSSIYWLGDIINDFPEELQFAFAKKNPYLLQHIEDPDKFKLDVVKENYHALDFISEPSEEMQIAGMQQSPEALYFIREDILSEKARQIYDIRIDRRNIYTMEDPCSEAIELAKKLKELGIKKCENIEEAIELARRLRSKEKRAEY